MAERDSTPGAASAANLQQPSASSDTSVMGVEDLRRRVEVLELDRKREERARNYAQLERVRRFPSSPRL